MNAKFLPLLACAWGAALVGATAPAADWRPGKPVEIIVGTPPGGPLDETARLVQALLEKRNVGVPVAVMNKPGGGHAIAMAYLNQRPGDAHYLSMALTNLITNRIVGSHPLTYTDVTPLALLTSEYIGMSVRSDSPVKDGGDLIARLRADPEALSFRRTSGSTSTWAAQTRSSSCRKSTGTSKCCSPSWAMRRSNLHLPRNHTGKSVAGGKHISATESHGDETSSKNISATEAHGNTRNWKQAIAAQFNQWECGDS